MKIFSAKNNFKPPETLQKKYFSEKIHVELVTIFAIGNQLNWNKLLFGFINSGMVNFQTRYQFRILSVTARKAVTRKWLEPATPSMDNQYEIVFDIFRMEEKSS